MNRLVEKCGIMSISLIWTITLIVSGISVYEGVHQRNWDSLLLAIAFLGVALPMTCVLATCICIARYTDPKCRAW